MSKKLRRALRDARRSESKKEQTGVMIALPVPYGSVVEAFPGWEQNDEVGDPHITLAILGDKSEFGYKSEIRQLKGAVEQWAANQEPFNGEINGHARFCNTGNDEGTDAVVLLYDSPALAAARTELVQALSNAGDIHVSEEHGFVPHITIGYVEKGANGLEDSLAAVPLQIETVGLHIGEEVVFFPLGSGLKEAFEQIHTCEALLKSSVINTAAAYLRMIKDFDDAIDKLYPIERSGMTRKQVMDKARWWEDQRVEKHEAFLAALKRAGIKLRRPATYGSGGGRVDSTKLAQYILQHHVRDTDDLPSGYVIKEAMIPGRVVRAARDYVEIIEESEDWERSMSFDEIRYWEDERVRAHDVFLRALKAAGIKPLHRGTSTDLAYAIAKGVRDTDKIPRQLLEVIKQQGTKWVLWSKDGKKKLGTYDTKEEAEERERQIQAAKHAKGETIIWPWPVTGMGRRDRSRKLRGKKHPMKKEKELEDEKR